MINLENKINKIACFINEHFGGISEVRCLRPMSECKIYFIYSDFNIDRDQRILSSFDDIQAEIKLIPEDVKNMAIPEEAKVLWSFFGYIDQFRRSRVTINGSCPVGIIRNACKYIKDETEANSIDNRSLKFHIEYHEINAGSCNPSEPCVHPLVEVENEANKGWFCRHDSRTFMWLSDSSAQKLNAVCQIYGIDLTPTYIKTMIPGETYRFRLGRLNFEVIKTNRSHPFAVICDECNVAIRWTNDPLSTAMDHAACMHIQDII